MLLAVEDDEVGVVRFRRDARRVAFVADHDDPLAGALRRGAAGGALRRAMLDDGGDCQQAGARLLRQGRTGEAGGKFLRNEVRGKLAGGEARQADERGQEADIVADAADLEGVEGLAHAADRLRPARAGGDQLGDHRVVEDGNVGAFIDAGIDADLLPVRRTVADQAAGRGQEAAFRILGVDARLERPAVEPDVLLREGKRLAGGDADHQLHEVEAGHQLGHRMLDLQPRVHLQEVEIAVAVDDELHRAGGAVADRPGQRHGLRAHRLPRRLVEKRARRLLDHLLMAALDRAFALAEEHDVAVRVAQHLDLDMAGLLDVFLDEDAAVAKARLRLAGRGAKALRDLGIGAGDPHALPAPARGGFEQHGVADVLRVAGGGFGVGDDPDMAGHGGDAGGAGELLGADLVAHRRHGGRRRADEDDAGLFERGGKARILREEPVARMHRLCAGRAARLDDGVDLQVALGRGRRADAHGLVGFAHMQRVGIGVGIDGDGGNPHAPGRAHDACGDFSAIGDEDFSEHLGGSDALRQAGRITIRSERGKCPASVESCSGSGRSRRSGRVNVPWCGSFPDRHAGSLGGFDDRLPHLVIRHSTARKLRQQSSGQGFRENRRAGPECSVNSQLQGMVEAKGFTE